MNNHERIKEVWLKVLEIYRRYHRHHNWETAIVGMNNGDCHWTSQLVARVLRLKYQTTVDLVQSDHHGYIRYDGKVYDSICIKGTEAPPEEFYGDWKNKAPVGPLETIFLYSWDEDIKHLCDLICDHYGVLKFEYEGVLRPNECPALDDEEYTPIDLTLIPSARFTYHGDSCRLTRLTFKTK